MEQLAFGTRSEFPNPRTTAGALRTWLLEALDVDFSKFREALGKGATLRESLKACLPEVNHALLEIEIKGPIACVSDPDYEVENYYHLPACFVRKETAARALKTPLVRLSPMSTRPTGYAPPVGSGDAFLPPGSGERHQDWPASAHVSAGAMKNLLDSRNFPLEEDLYNIVCHEYRTGVALDPDKRLAKDGQLYGSAFLRLGLKGLPALGLRVDVTVPEAVKDCLATAVARQPYLPLGGERRVAGVRLAPQAAAVPAAPVPWDEAERFTTVLATPAVFSKGWYPEELAKKHTLISAVVPPPQPFSGWDIARGRPEPSRYAVPAGAVYFWQKGKDADTEDPHDTCISDAAEDRQAGWGLCLRGAWDYAE